MKAAVVEDITPCCDVKVSLRIDRPVQRATLEPQGTELPFRAAAGRVEFELDRFTCHQMIALETP